MRVRLVMFTVLKFINYLLQLSRKKICVKMAYIICTILQKT